MSTIRNIGWNESERPLFHNFKQ